MRTMRPSERGSVLILALLVTLIILGVGMTVMWLASSGSKVSGNLVRRQEALYAAEAGIERARRILFTNRDWNQALLGCGSSKDNVETKGRVLCEAGTALDDERLVPAGSTTETKATGVDLSKLLYTVWVRNDWNEECDTIETELSKVDCDGDGTANESADRTAAMTDGNNRIIIRSEGIGRDGLSYVAVEAIISMPTKLVNIQGYTQVGQGSHGANFSSGELPP